MCAKRHKQIKTLTTGAIECADLSLSTLLTFSVTHYWMTGSVRNFADEEISTFVVFTL